MGCCFSARNRSPSHKSKTSGNPTVGRPALFLAYHSYLPQPDVQADDVSNTRPSCEEQEQGCTETLQAGGQSLGVTSGSVVSPDENGELAITGIRAMDVAVGLGRFPAGFYVAVHHSGREWRTENKRVALNANVIEWDGPIPIPSDPSAVIRLEVYASFEIQPTLGVGEMLRQLTITVAELLDRDVKDFLFTFSTEDGGSVSPCSSLSMTVGAWASQSSSALKALDPHPSIPEWQCQLEDATNHGHLALSRYQKYRERRDLELSVEEFERALTICPLDHPYYAVTQSNIAVARFIQCQLDDAGLSLDVPLTLYRNALAARPVGHPDRPSTLIQLAAVHIIRFQKHRHDIDAVEAEALLDEAHDLSSAESHENLATMTLMALLYAARHINDDVETSGQAPMESGSTSGLTNGNALASSARLLGRFKQFGIVDDLQQGVSILEQFVSSTPKEDENYLQGLSEFGLALSYRFHCLGDPGDLDQAISTFRIAISLTPEDHPDKADHLTILGACLVTRFERFGDLSDLEQAISIISDAINLTPDYHSRKPACLDMLGYAFKIRFERLRAASDLDQMISRFRDAVHFTLDNSPDKPDRLRSLGSSFRARFELLGQIGDLEEAILIFKAGISITPDDHPAKPGHLSDLGTSLVDRFKRLGKVNDLDEGISTFSDAIDLNPPGHPHRHVCLNNLAASLTVRFDRLGEVNDLDQAISLYIDSISITPSGHPQTHTTLKNLGDSFLTRFRRIGSLSDLEQGILRLRGAVDLTPHNHPDRCSRLNALSGSLLTRFQRLGEASDLEEAISRSGEAMSLIPDGHTEKPVYLGNLGNGFLSRFQHFGELSDLEQAMSRFRCAVDLTPDGDPDKWGHLCDLGNSFFNSFQHLGDLGDLEQAMSKFTNAIPLIPDGHPDKSVPQHLLGNCFRARFERLQDFSDLEQAISNQEDAVTHTPDGHFDKPARLNSLANSFLTRFERLGEPCDLEHAIEKYEDAVALVPDGHPQKPVYLNNLGISFATRFNRFEEVTGLEKAISSFRDAVNLTPDHHPQGPVRLNNLGNTSLTRFLRLREPSDIEQAISLFSRAACISSGSTTARFMTSQKWILCARTSAHHSLLDAYSTTIDLLPQVAWIGFSLTDRYRELLRGANVVREAAAAALDAGNAKTAVEWLEQGRSVVWGGLFQLRSSYDELSLVYPNYADRLRKLSSELEDASATREKSLSSLSGRTHGTGNSVQSLEKEAERHRALAIERDRLLREIRGLPGFERFLLHKEFSQLRASARFGPVVILNAAENRCDALIVLADVDDVVHVPLPDFNLERSEGLQTSLKGVLHREGKPMRLDHSKTWKSILATLWKSAVRPVLDALNLSTPGNPSHIFWCPTGPFTFLPIHAAGLHDEEHSEPGHKLFDFAISSYVPTLSTLTPPPERDTNPTPKVLHFLVVRQPSSDGLSPLPGVSEELNYIKEVVQSNPSTQTTLLESSTGTVEDVLELMKEADWVHFACHGAQDDETPADSGLCLADGRRLKLSDVVALSRPHGGFAFLSACETAMGDKGLSDEAIHIAAGMLFAGYGSVVATMWSISDRVAPRVAKDVYEQLFQSGKRPDAREAARALQDAIRRLRDSGAAFEEWLPFIHVGL